MPPINLRLWFEEIDFLPLPPDSKHPGLSKREIPILREEPPPIACGTSSSPYSGAQASEPTMLPDTGSSSESLSFRL